MPRRPGGVLLLVGVVVLAVAVRLITINQPFIDTWSWRQSDVAAIARNYLHGGFRFAWPQIDWAGTAEGYVGTEFPILPFTAALAYKITGVHEWVGRLQTLLFFILSVPFFAALVKEIYGERESLWAVVFYCFAPLSVMTSRCFMPDMPSLSLSLIGLYNFKRWIETSRWQLFAAAVVTTALALLIKLPTAIIGAAFGCVALEKFGAGAFRRPALWLFAALVMLPSALWYWHAADLAGRFYPYHFFGEGGVRLMSLGWYAHVAHRTVEYSLTIVLSGLAFAGIFVAMRRSASSLFYWWLGATILFVIGVGYGNRHPWYQLPFVPIGAVFAGCAMTKLFMKLGDRMVLKRAVTGLIMLLFVAETVRANRLFFRPAAADLQTLGLALKQHTGLDTRIVIADYGDPTAFYYAERKGWHFLETHGVYNGHPNVSADAIEDLRRLREQGATYVAFYSGTRWWLEYYSDFNRYLADSSQLIEKTPEYEIYQLH